MATLMTGNSEQVQIVHTPNMYNPQEDQSRLVRLGKGLLDALTAYGITGVTIDSKQGEVSATLGNPPGSWGELGGVVKGVIDAYYPDEA